MHLCMQTCWWRLAAVQSKHQNRRRTNWLWGWWLWLLVPDMLVWLFWSPGIFTTSQPSLGFTENRTKKRKYPKCWSCVAENEWLMSGVGDHRKATTTQGTTGCNQGLQNSISERTTPPSFETTLATWYRLSVSNIMAGECIWVKRQSFYNVTIFIGNHF